MSKLKENLSVIIIGCIWGILEPSLGGLLHYIHYPLKGQIMSTIAYALLAAYAIRYRKVWELLVMGFIAAILKLFTVFIFGVPLC